MYLYDKSEPTGCRQFVSISEHVTVLTDINLVRKWRQSQPRDCTSLGFHTVDNKHYQTPPSSLLPLSLNLIMLFLIRSTSPQSNMKRSVLIIFILLLSHSWEILIPVEREQDFLKDDTFNKRKGTLVTRTAHFNVNFG